MRYTILLTIFLSLIAVESAGASTGSRIPEGLVVKRTPEQLAQARYESGIKRRDKAADLEARAASEGNAKKHAALDKKIAKEYGKSITEFQKAIKFSPRFYKAHAGLGYALGKVGQSQDALAAYDKALSINPEFGMAIHHRGEAYLQLDRLDDAKQAYLSLLHSEPERADRFLKDMLAWVGTHREDSRGVNDEAVARFASWVDQRIKIASGGQSHD